MEFHTGLCEITTQPPDSRLLQLYWPSRRFLQGLSLLEQDGLTAKELNYSPLEILDNLVDECSDFPSLHEAGFGEEWMWFVNEILNQWPKHWGGSDPHDPYRDFFMEGHKAFIREQAQKHGREIAQAGSARRYIRINDEKVIYEDEIEDTPPVRYQQVYGEWQRVTSNNAPASATTPDQYSAFRSAMRR